MIGCFRILTSPLVDALRDDDECVRRLVVGADGLEGRLDLLDLVLADLLDLALADAVAVEEDHLGEVALVVLFVLAQALDEHRLQVVGHLLRK